jgi:hypothetical protein
MTIRAVAGVVHLTGHCPSEDAETLLGHLVAMPGAAVDWRHCTGAHSAVLQLLLVARPQLLGPPADALLARWLQPLLTPAASR